MHVGHTEHDDECTRSTSNYWTQGSSAVDSCPGLHNGRVVRGSTGSNTRHGCIASGSWLSSRPRGWLQPRRAQRSCCTPLLLLPCCSARARRTKPCHAMRITHADSRPRAAASSTGGEQASHSPPIRRRSAGLRLELKRAVRQARHDAAGARTEGSYRGLGRHEAAKRHQARCGMAGAVRDGPVEVCSQRLPCRAMHAQGIPNYSYPSYLTSR